MTLEAGILTAQGSLTPFDRDMPSHCSQGDILPSEDSVGNSSQGGGMFSEGGIMTRGRHGELPRERQAAAHLRRATYYLLHRGGTVTPEGATYFLNATIAVGGWRADRRGRHASFGGRYFTFWGRRDDRRGRHATFRGRRDDR